MTLTQQLLDVNLYNGAEPCNGDAPVHTTLTCYSVGRNPVLSPNTNQHAASAALVRHSSVFDCMVPEVELIGE